jgi:hypothetical protein
VTPSPCVEPPKVERPLTSAPRSSSRRTAAVRPLAAGPHQRAAAIDVGLELRAARDERLEHVDAVAARRPRERFVAHLLRVVRRPPIGEAAVRAVVGAVGAGLGGEAAVGRDELLDQVEAPEAGGGAQVARVHAAALGQQLGHLAMAPEEPDDERRAALAAGRDVDGDALVEQHARQPRQVRVRRLVQRRPAVVVAAGGIGTGVEQDAHEPLVVGRACHPEQVVAVRADGACQVGEAVELRAQPVDVVGLDGAVGAGERLARVAQARDVAAQRRPRLEAVRRRPTVRAPASVTVASQRSKAATGARRAVARGRVQARRRGPRSSRGPRGRRARGRAVRGQALHIGLQARQLGTRARARRRAGRP